MASVESSVSSYEPTSPCKPTVGKLGNTGDYCSNNAIDNSDAASSSTRTVDVHHQPDSPMSSNRDADTETDHVSQGASDSVSESEDTLDAETDSQSDVDAAVERRPEVEEEKRPGETIFERHQTIMIFDWDDTLLPSTWLTLHGMRLDDDCVVSDEMSVLLKELADFVMKTLDAANEVGVVVIVTNAENGWIELSCRKFMPTLAEYLEKMNFRIMSARSTFEPLGIVSPFDWKNRAFSQEIESYYASLAGDHSRCKRNILSFGDSSHEREAILNVTRAMTSDHVTKSLKFVERPMIDQLRKEHELITGCMRQIVYHSVNLDLCVRTQ